eukprot:1428373-Rhodomonas_salina.1
MATLRGVTTFRWFTCMRTHRECHFHCMKDLFERLPGYPGSLGSRCNASSVQRVREWRVSYRVAASGTD